MGTPLGNALESSARASPPPVLYPVSAENVSSPAPGFGSSEDGAPRAEAVSSSSEFSHGAVLLLLRAVGRRWAGFGPRERSLLFQRVQADLQQQGLVLPAHRIRRKWNNLIVTYKRVRERSASGPPKTSWEYYEMMDSILGKTALARRGPASATLVGLASSAQVRVGSGSAAAPETGPSAPAPAHTHTQTHTSTRTPAHTPGPRRLQARVREERPAVLRFLPGPARSRAGSAVALERIASALELLCSKQDAAIALLQRIADRI